MSTQDTRHKRMTAAQAQSKYGYTGNLKSKREMSERPKIKVKKSSYK